MERVRIGIIGTSWWSNGFFLPIFSGYGRSDLVAICGRNQERAGEMATKYSIPQVYSDYRQMIDDANLDALVVASPSVLHYEMTMAGLDAGLHVLCEIPLTHQASQARQMLDKAEAVGVKHMINYTWRWLPQIQYLKYLLAQGQLGRVYQANFRIAFVWRYGEYFSGNGVVGGIGGHMIDMAHWMLGDVVSVSASLKTQFGREGEAGRPLNPANDSAFVLLDFSSGAHCSIQSSFVNHMADERGIAVSIYGEKGTVQTDYSSSRPDCQVRGAWRDEKAIHPLEVPSEYLRGFETGDMFRTFAAEGLRRFIDSILDDTAVTPNFYDGYEAGRIIDAALESQRSGQRITIA